MGYIYQVIVGIVDAIGILEWMPFLVVVVVVVVMRSVMMSVVLVMMRYVVEEGIKQKVFPETKTHSIYGQQRGT